MIYPTLIVFAGPNGAGKSTLKRRLEALNYPLGVYINPDDIAATLGGTYEARSRVAQSIAEQRRQACIARREDFSFETVMSHPSKIALMRQAAAAGYTITLFFVSVEDPEICVARVRQRVALGGHDVPVERIVRRYQATMSALGDAVRTADRTVLFESVRRIVDLFQ